MHSHFLNHAFYIRHSQWTYENSHILRHPKTRNIQRQLGGAPFHVSPRGSPGQCSKTLQDLLQTTQVALLRRVLDCLTSGRGTGVAGARDG